MPLYSNFHLLPVNLPNTVQANQLTRSSGPPKLLGSGYVSGSVTIESDVPIGPSGHREIIGPAGVTCWAVYDDNWVSPRSDFRKYEDIYGRWFWDDPGAFRRAPIQYPFDIRWDIDGIERVMHGPALFDDFGNIVGVESTGTGNARRPKYTPSGTIVNRLGPDRNIGYGPEAGHTYCMVLEDWNGEPYRDFYVVYEARIFPSMVPSAVAYTSFRVFNPLVYCQGVYVINEGGITHGDHPGGGAVYADMTQAKAAAAIDGYSSQLFLYRREETHVMSASWNRPAPKPISIVMTYGAGGGGNPEDMCILEFAQGLTVGNVFNGGTGLCAFSGFDIRGAYRSDAPTFTPGGATAPGYAIQPNAHVTLCNMRTKGYDRGTGCGVPIPGSSIHLSDIYIGDYFAYGIWQSETGLRVSAHGIWIQQPETIVHDDGVADIPVVSQGPYRGMTGRNSIFSMNMVYTFGPGGAPVSSMGQPHFRPYAYPIAPDDPGSASPSIYFNRVYADQGRVDNGSPGNETEPKPPATHDLYRGAATTITAILEMAIMVVPNHQKGLTAVPGHSHAGYVQRAIMVTSTDQEILPENPSATPTTSEYLMWGTVVNNVDGDYSAEYLADRLDHYDWTMVDVRPPAMMASNGFRSIDPVPPLTPSLRIDNSVVIYARSHATRVTDPAGPPEFVALGGVGNYLLVADDMTETGLHVDVSQSVLTSNYVGYQWAQEFLDSDPVHTECSMAAVDIYCYIPTPNSAFIDSVDPDGRHSVFDAWGIIRCHVVDGQDTWDTVGGAFTSLEVMDSQVV